MPPIFHLALADEWAAAPAGGYDRSTLGQSLADVGFIHCSFAHQVQTIADAVYKGRDDVVLLEIDPARLHAPLQVDDSFPHIYGPLHADAVVRVTPLARRDDGTLAADAATRTP